MKATLTKLFWPILRIFETGADAKHYKPSHRVVLIVIGALFTLLSVGSAFSASGSAEFGAYIPMVVFLGVGIVALVVGSLGSNSAVVKIWGKQ